MGAVKLKNGIVIKYNKLDPSMHWENAIQIWKGDCLFRTLDRAYTSRELVEAILSKDNDTIVEALAQYALALERSAMGIRTIIGL